MDNFVDKSLRQRPSAAKRRLAWSTAQKNSTQKPLNINYLQHKPAAVKVTTVRNASIGAAVERSLRTSGCFADG